MSLAQPLEQLELGVLHHIPIPEKYNQKMRVRSGEKVFREAGDPILDIVWEDLSIKAFGKISDEVLQFADFGAVLFGMDIGDVGLRVKRDGISVGLKIVDIIEVERIDVRLFGGVDARNWEDRVALKG